MKKTLVPQQDYVVKEIPFPNNAADGVVVSNPDGICTIIINQNVCPARKKKALKHELNHIMNDDLYSDEDITVLEKRADEGD